MPASGTARVAYFDCYSGISGDMILGALADLGADLKEIRRGLGTLKLSGYEIRGRRVRRGMLSATKVDVAVKLPKGKRVPARRLADIEKLIRGSGLPGTVKENAAAVFKRLAKAEAKVHRTTVQKVHFHEVGAVDSIVDIVGGVYGLELLGVQRVLASPLNVGEGFVECEHGTLPVPAPATLKLLEGIPCFSTGVRKELTTPTGAAMIGHYAAAFQSLPEMTVLKTGYGAGDHRVESVPNLLRVILGDMPDRGADETVMVVETNIDDMNPEFYDSVMESLFKAGGLDVWFTPIIMKKGRPAVTLSLLAPASRLQECTRILLTETSTFGVRVHAAGRTVLSREIRTVDTPYGKVKVKVGSLEGAVVKVAPEYEDCKKIARREKLPLRVVYQEILGIAAGRFGK